jgi:hypothetical protein
MGGADKMLRGKVKTKHDITWFAQKTNVDQLNPAYVYDSGGVKNKKNIFLLFTLYRVLGNVPKMKIVFMILLEVLQQK